ncbi:MAG: hypothetical protein E7665_08330 [Ruminococcaceae bacterium]|nr:hypothetical protein [Oscillospiraceae bacterium]
MKEIRYIASPSRNFCILNYNVMQDPKDNIEKLMFTSFVSGGTGMFAIVDPIANVGESYEFPCDNGAWAVCRVDERRVAIGTCAAVGVIHTFDLIDRKFIKTSKVEGNTYVWNLAKASDGNLYGGTYGGNSLVKYHADTMEAEVVARCDDNPKNMYSRTVYPDVNGSGKIIVTSGMEENHLLVYDIYEQKPVKSIPGTMLSYNCAYFAVNASALGDGKTPEHTKEAKEIRYFNSETCEEISKDELPEAVPVRDKLLMSDGTRVSGYKQGYKVTFPDGSFEIKNYPVLAPATGIHTMVCDDNEKIWASSGFGQTVAHLDPDTGEFKNTNSVTNNGGEVYGIVPYEDRVYFTAYNGGIHIVYYPDREWNQEENVNPNTFRLINKEGYIRPNSRSHIGPGGYIYTGFTADYGVYGGAVSRIDPKTNEVKLWENKVNDCGITALGFDKEHIYAVTTSGGNGLPERRDIPTYIFKLNSELELIEYKDIGKTYFYGTVYSEGKIYITGVTDGKYFFAIGEEGMKEYTVKYFDNITIALNLSLLHGTDKLIFTWGNKVCTMDKDGENIEIIAEAEKHINHMCVTKSGRVFIGCVEKVYEVCMK